MPLTGPSGSSSCSRSRDNWKRFGGYSLLEHYADQSSGHHVMSRKRHCLLMCLYAHLLRTGSVLLSLAAACHLLMRRSIVYRSMQPGPFTFLMAVARPCAVHYVQTATCTNGLGPMCRITLAQYSLRLIVVARGLDCVFLPNCTERLALSAWVCFAV